MLEFLYYSQQTLYVKFWTQSDETVQQGALDGYPATASSTVTNLYRADPPILDVPAGGYYVTIHQGVSQAGAFVATRVDSTEWLTGDTFDSICCEDDNQTIIITPSESCDDSIKIWEEELTTMLRTEIGDLDSSVYSDSRLRQVLVYAAYSVYQSARFVNNYCINVSNITICPDPVSTNDFDFSILTVYKAACIIMTGEAKEKGGKSVSIKDGPSFFDNRNSGTNTMNLMKIMCENYNTLLYNYQMVGSDHSDLAGLGQAILSPYSPGSFLAGWNRNDHRSGGYRW